MKKALLLPVAALALGTGLSTAAQAQVAQEPGFTLDYQLSIPSSASFNSTAIPYTTDNSPSIANGSFDRVAYELTLSGSTNTAKSPNGNIWVSFDPQSAVASKLGVPNTASGELYGGGSTVQFVNNMTVIASSGFSSLAGTGITDGNIQFWPTDYSGNPSTGNFDWANTNGGSQGGNYASMDISEVNPKNHAQGQMLISYNDWGSDGGNSDLGLGNSPSGSPNYTFSHNAGDYGSAILTVWVHPTPEPASLGTFAVAQSACSPAADGRDGGSQKRDPPRPGFQQLGAFFAVS